MSVVPYNIDPIINPITSLQRPFFFLTFWSWIWVIVTVCGWPLTIRVDLVVVRETPPPLEFTLKEDEEAKGPGPSPPNIMERKPGMPPNPNPPEKKGSSNGLENTS